MKTTQADYVRTALRLPRDLHQAVHREAAQEQRTFNAQLIHMIKASLPHAKQPKN